MGGYVKMTTKIRELYQEYYQELYKYKLEQLNKEIDKMNERIIKSHKRIDDINAKSQRSLSNRNIGFQMILKITRLMEKYVRVMKQERFNDLTEITNDFYITAQRIDSIGYH